MQVYYTGVLHFVHKSFFSEKILHINQVGKSNVLGELAALKLLH